MDGHGRGSSYENRHFPAGHRRLRVPLLSLLSLCPWEWRQMWLNICKSSLHGSLRIDDSNMIHSNGYSKDVTFSVSCHQGARHPGKVLPTADALNSFFGLGCVIEHRMRSRHWWDACPAQLLPLNTAVHPRNWHSAAVKADVYQPWWFAIVEGADDLWQR